MPRFPFLIKTCKSSYKIEKKSLSKGTSTLRKKLIFENLEYSPGTLIPKILNKLEQPARAVQFPNFPQTNTKKNKFAKNSVKVYRKYKFC